MGNKIFDIKIGTETIDSLISRVDVFLKKPKDKIFHIMNLNPDIFIHGYRKAKFRKIINLADFILIDGVGIKIAAKVFGKKSGQRLTGTDLMTRLVEFAALKNKKVMFLGGQNRAAQLTGEVFKKKYPSLRFASDQGTENITNEKEEEKRQVVDKIKKFKPEFLFVAYGPPYQEQWIYDSRRYFKGIVCMGVGGAFNFVSGRIPRAPKIIIGVGFEWLWRFIFEPSRLIRKLPRYIYFAVLIMTSFLKRNR